MGYSKFWLSILGLIAVSACVEKRQADEYGPVAVSGNHHFVMFENDSVRVLEVIIPPGETTALHHHTLSSVFITLESASRFSKLQNGLTVSTVDRLDDEELPKVEWRGPGQFPVQVTNTDTVQLHAYRIELK